MPFLTIALAAVAASATAAPPADSDRGWFFYENPPPIVEEVEPEPEPKPLSGGAGKGSDVGSVRWIRENIDRFRDAAIDHPTKENLELFAYVQKLMMDKSEIFARQLVATNAANPALDETISTPTNSPARMELNTERDQAQMEALSQVAKQSVVWYFFRSDCPYCQKQDPILAYLQRTTDIRILPISVDGQGLLDGAFPDYVTDHGQAAKLNVTATPTLYLMSPPDKLVVLSIGMRSLPDLLSRFVEVGHAQKLVDDSTYETAVNGLPRQFLTTTFDPNKIEDPDDPKQILQALRSAGVYGVSSASTSDVGVPGEPIDATPIANRTLQ